MIKIIEARQINVNVEAVLFFFNFFMGIRVVITDKKNLSNAIKYIDLHTGNTSNPDIPV